MSPRVQDRILGLGVVAYTKHPVADCDVGHSFSDLVDHTRGVVAGITGALKRLALRVHARCELPVGPIEACGFYLDANLSGSCVRLWRLSDAEDFGPAILGELQRKH